MSKVTSPTFPFSIWKVSHGANDISEQQSQWLDQNCYLTVHQDTKKSQGSAFSDGLSIGSLVSLSRSGDVKSLVRVTSGVIDCDDSPLDEGWLVRSYQIVCELPKPIAYDSRFKRGWTPNYNGTIYRVPREQFADFEEQILRPFYGLSLQEITQRMVEQDDRDEQVVLQPQEQVSHVPLNQILYGPPGTGKTYHTIEAAVKAADPEFYLGLNIDQKVGATTEQRAALQKKYQQLCDAKRIRFVTFHQSYGYEEFVEGLRANTTEDNQVSYRVEDGIFKKACRAASNEAKGLLETFIDQVSIEPIELTTKNNHEFLCSVDSSSNRKSFDITPQSTQTRQDARYADVSRYLGGEAENDNTHNYSYVRAIGEYLKQKFKPSTHDKPNYVLIIDEINRGNISKIFGELITLLEPSKRFGQSEAITLTLPYSGDQFSVPDNLYLIGTMNTADRSLAMMDTALRRRFEFVEMMPTPSLLSNVVVKGIDLEKLLETLNQRIEVLYDREHTLGHAFFMPVKECVKQGDDNQAFIVLKSVFQNKIIPLLEEYFFEDWNKIRLVLADNQKAENAQLEDLQFISEQKLTTTALGTLFGHNHGLNQYGEEQQKFTLKDKTDSVWDNPSAYIGIYSLGQASGD